MTIDFMEYLRETFDNLENLDLGKIQSIATETSAYLASLGETIQAGDGKAKEEAMAQALELQEFLETKTKSVIEASGVSREELLSVADNSAFTEEEKKVITNISESLDSVKKNKKNKIKKIKPIPMR